MTEPTNAAVGQAMTTPLLALAVTGPQELHTAHRAPGLASVGRYINGLVAIDATGTVYGLGVVTEDAEALESVPVWPVREDYAELDPLLPASVDLLVAYVGPNARRAVGGANAELLRRVRSPRPPSGSSGTAWSTG